ncbi:MAG TPA: DUF389 domain-containing protein [Gemmatimonadales bacterium]|nr:DUF389 domain-containing protein [Gemmatimonadales bacterium]
MRIIVAMPEQDTTPPSPRETARVWRTLQRTVVQLQDHLAALLGVGPAARRGTVGAMLESNARRVPGYWIQLLLSTGIATLGLVLGSTAVVIGAMLVSPLMGPLVELGMGFAVGSSLLVVRATLRVAMSVLLVLAGATIITFLVPFHEVTAEVASRTAPTALDLLVAIFCALTAAYTTIRPGSDTASAAAGTAIGIALVPPLCAAGFGLGTGSGAVASGAALLFVANFSGILLVSVVTFLLLGYNRIDAAALELEYLEHPENRVERLAQRAHRYLARVLGSRYGLATRLLVPGLFLAAVYVPLSRALDDVTWQVKVRDEIRRILARESSRAMQSALVVERRNVSLRLWMVGTRDDAQQLERRLETRIAAVAGVAPAVTVSAVPDASMLTAAAATGRDARAGAARVDEFTRRAKHALVSAWPAAAAGPLASWQLEADSRGEWLLRVQHQGAALGPAGEALLSAHVSAELGTPLRVVDEPLPVQPIVARRGAEAAWLVDAARIVALTVRTDSLVACARGPRAGRGATDRAIVAALRAAAAVQTSRLVVEPARSWSLRVARASCRRAT